MTLAPHVYFGTVLETECRVFADREDEQGPAGLDKKPGNSPFVGHVRGPFCRYAHTLPVNHAFRPLRAAPARAEAWLPDPCFWTPAMPFIYQYSLAESNDTTAERHEGWLGLRRLTAEGENLMFDRKRWVLRAARWPQSNGPGDVTDTRGDLHDADEPLGELASQWHDAALATLARQPSAAFCRQASELGVLIVAEVPTTGDAAGELRRLRAWPAVGIIILDPDHAPPDPRAIARNVLFGQRFAAAAPIRPAAWADVIFCDIEPADGRIGADTVPTKPFVAVRKAESAGSPATARALCDRLQRDLAGGMNWAGYVVDSRPGT